MAVPTAAGAALGSASNEPDSVPQFIDHALFEEFAAQQQVVTGMPRFGLTQYLQETSFRLATQFGDWVFSLFGGLAGFLGSGVQWFLLILFVALGGLVLLLLTRALAGRHKRPIAVSAVEVRGTSEEETGWGEGQWEGELRRRIKEGEGDQAATALWWWLASRLVPSGIEGAWTSRELLERTGRRDLRPGLRSLDRLLYGPLEPATAEVVKLWDEFLEILR
jgi:hypothetical protein